MNHDHPAAVASAACLVPCLAVAYLIPNDLERRFPECQTTFWGNLLLVLPCINPGGGPIDIGRIGGGAPVGRAPVGGRPIGVITMEQIQKYQPQNRRKANSTEIDNKHHLHGCGGPPRIGPKWVRWGMFLLGASKYTQTVRCSAYLVLAQLELAVSERLLFQQLALLLDLR